MILPLRSRLLVPAAAAVHMRLSHGNIVKPTSSLLDQRSFHGYC